MYVPRLHVSQNTKLCCRVPSVRNGKVRALLRDLRETGPDPPPPRAWAGEQLTARARRTHLALISPSPRPHPGARLHTPASPIATPTSNPASGPALLRPSRHPREPIVLVLIVVSSQQLSCFLLHPPDNVVCHRTALRRWASCLQPCSR
ncbi:hypothetical protein BDZ91DRAFT_528751 [Kalaharituber pfeilii]|nr:hypothetical protein BDZ91DRAFT_528751 [Kalaharituber pfeilii]